MIEIFLAPATILWSSAPSTANAVISGTPSYTLNNMRLCMSRISFQNDEYYNLLASKLLDESGLLIAYKDVYQVRSTSTAKSSSLSWNYNINANSLDSILCVPNRSDYNTFSYLQLFGSENIGTTEVEGGTIATNYLNYTLNELLAIQGQIVETANKSVGGTDGDLFNNSQYFQRKNTGFKNGQFLVNSITYDPYQKTLDEVYNEALINLGFKNLDVNGSGHVGILSIWHFCKYYFVEVANFENLEGGSGQFWKSGLSGNSAPINIQYNAQYDGNAGDSVYLNFFNVMTKILQVGAGRTITVI